MRFILLFGDSEEHEITTECQIGRREGDLKFSDEHLSGVHGKFYVQDSRLYVMDLGSSNGTRINGKKIAKHVPHEVLHEDKVEMGTQTLEVKIAEYTSSIHVELPKTDSEKTSIEVLPSISKEENTQETLQEATHIEVAPNSVSIDEGTHVEALATAEKTHIEAFVAPVAPPIEENTKIELAPAPLAYTPPHKYVEDEKANKAHFKAVLPEDEVQENKALTFKEKVLQSAHSLHQSFGTTQIVIVSALCLGLFAFFIASPSKMASKRTVEREQASVANKEDNSAPAPVVETTVAETTATEAAETAAVDTAQNPIIDQQAAQETSPTPENVSAAQENTSANSETIANKIVETPAPQEVEESTEVVETPVVKKAPKKATAKATKKSVANKTSNKTRDPYNEVALLKTLTKIKSEAKRTSSYRVKAALEVDAAEAVTQHYQKIKNRINTRWKNARSLASDEKQKVKEILQSQLIAVNNRERAVKARLSLYVHGKLNTPL